MPKVKSAADIAEKWSRVTPGRQQDFEAGVKDPTVDWERATAAAGPSYEAGVQEAIQRGSFTKGVAASGNDKWRRKVADVGAGRWGAGVRGAAADFEEGFAPVREVIERTQLPPRGPRGDPRNIERAAEMARALSEARKRR